MVLFPLMYSLIQFRWTTFFDIFPFSVYIAALFTFILSSTIFVIASKKNKFSDDEPMGIFDTIFLHCHCLLLQGKLIEMNLISISL